MDKPLRMYTPETYPETGWKAMREQHAHGDEQIRALLEFLASLSRDYEDATFTPPHLGTITARTMIVHGDRDYCFPVSLATQMYESIPDAYLYVLPYGDHVPITGWRAVPFMRMVTMFLGGSW